MTVEEMAKIINDVHGNFLFSLYERWQDEKEYEDFSDYAEVFKKKVPETIKGTKKPFGFMIKCDNGTLHVIVKRKGNYLVIAFKEIA